MNNTKMAKEQQKLKKQLEQIGITKAVAGVGTYDGSPVVFLRWNGDEEEFSGFVTTGVTRFQDDKLK